MADKKIVGLIPARGGSKRVPGKNIRLLLGKPLIAWTIETARTCPALDRVIVSTDDPEIAEIARSAGAEVPFLRPPDLAADKTPDLPVYQHALGWLAEQQGYFPAIVAWLRPTAPLRTAEDITAAIELLIETGADWVRSVCPVEHHPYWMKRLEEGSRLTPFLPGKDESQYYQRQLLPPLYRLNGAVDVSWRATIMEKGLIYAGNMHGYVMPPERSVDIDDMLDFALTESLLKARKS